VTDNALTIVGHVESVLVEREAAPRQAHEGAPDAWLVFEPQFHDALRDLRAGDEVLLLTWLHQADRNVLVVHPRGDLARPLEGVFSTRSSHRPNPIGLHRVLILAIDQNRIHVNALEAVHGTPILDIKPVLDPSTER
jgi:tRNA-Thr(GGU) m(6)t(6)A37 methyltransferase TsaA